MDMLYASMLARLFQDVRLLLNTTVLFNACIRCFRVYRQLAWRRPYKSHFKNYGKRQSCSWLTVLPGKVSILRLSFQNGV